MNNETGEPPVRFAGFLQQYRKAIDPIRLPDIAGTKIKEEPDPGKEAPLKILTGQVPEIEFVAYLFA
ncbi:MAG: hypothetical protein IJ651_03390 [Bacteroidales bacterium]|nr:hypothetical protein [Bacteroidales bacterium]